MKKRRVLFILALLSSLVGASFYWLQSTSGLKTDKFYEVKILSLDKQIAAVCEDYQEKLSQSDLLKLEKTLQEQTTALKTSGWSDRSIAGGYLIFLDPQQDSNQLFAYLEERFQSSQVFGSSVFQDLWNLETDSKDPHRC